MTTALSDVSRVLTAPANATLKRQPLFVQATELFARPVRSAPWLVSELFTRGGIGQIAAEPKTCKTWVATEISVAITTGTRAFGHFAAEQGKVAYFYAEDDEQQVRNRVRALLRGRGWDPDELDGLYVCPRGEFLDLTRNDDLAWVVASGRQLGKLDALVLDPLRDINSAAENESDDMSALMRGLRLVGSLLDCMVLVVHHQGKSGVDTKGRRPGQRSRGSSVIHGATDSGLYLSLVGGDGTRHFAIGASSEIKGARSAGYFSLSLNVQDDDAGEAMVATWTVDRNSVRKGASGRTAKGHDQAALDDATMLEFVQSLASRGEHLSLTKLRDHRERPIGQQRAEDALNRLMAGNGPLERRSNFEIHLRGGR